MKAEGNSLVDLLDNYMKKCTDKKIIPIGGVLHLVYDEAWNPPGQSAEINQHRMGQFMLVKCFRAKLETKGGKVKAFA